MLWGLRTQSSLCLGCISCLCYVHKTTLKFFQSVARLCFCYIRNCAVGNVKVKVTQLCLCGPMELYNLWNSPGQNTEVGNLSLLQGIFATRRSNPDLPHCKGILYQMSHKGSPRILEWVAIPFSRRSSRPRNWTRVSCIAGGFLTNWAIREVHSRQRATWMWSKWFSS